MNRWGMVVCVLGLCWACVGSVLADELTLERTVQRPAPGRTIPVKLTFAPDGETITYLKAPEGSLVQDLWTYSLATKEHSVLLSASELGGGVREGKVSLEEELRRARLRELGEGLTDYQWASSARVLLLPLGGDLLLWKDGKLRRMTESPEPEMWAKLSSDGSSLAYVRNGTLYAIEDVTAEPKERAISPVGSADHFYGTAEFIAQEELGRGEGFWLSPSGADIAFTGVEQAHVTSFPIVHQGKQVWGEPQTEHHRYPFAGEENARVRLYRAEVEGGEPVEVLIPGLTKGYLMHVQWIPGTRSLAVSVLDRDQQVYSVWEAAPGTAARLLVKERAETWIDNPGRVVFIREAGGEVSGFLRADTSSGWRRIRRHDRTGKAVEYLTPEQTWVDRLHGLNAEASHVYFEGTMADPRQRLVHRVPLAGGTVEVLGVKRGVHSGVFNRQKSHFLDVGSHLEEPVSVVLRKADGTAQEVLHAPEWEEARKLGLKPPEVFDVEAEDGSTLHGHLFRPEGETPKGGWPAILYPYGGPTHQVVMDSWGVTSNLHCQYLARRGFLVLRVDNRGTPRRGHGFSHSVYHRLGTLEIADQVSGAKALVAREGVDAKRIGIMGWSYGGYMASMAMAKASDTFRVAFVGAPVTDWRGYDTAYTERYMGRPQDQPEAYEEGSVMNHLEKMEGSMMVVHGMIDENVHFRHSAVLIEALLRHGKTHRIMVYPEARHSPRRNDERVFVYGTVYDFMEEELSAP